MARRGVEEENYIVKSRRDEKIWGDFLKGEQTPSEEATWIMAGRLATVTVEESKEIILYLKAFREWSSGHNLTTARTELVVKPLLKNDNQTGVSKVEKMELSLKPCSPETTLSDLERMAQGVRERVQKIKEKSEKMAEEVSEEEQAASK